MGTPGQKPVATIQIRVVDAMQDGNNGLITVRLQSSQVTGNVTENGPIRSYSIDPDTLVAFYGGNLKSWLSWVKGEQEKFNGVFLHLTTQLQGLKGTVL